MTASRRSGLVFACAAVLWCAACTTPAPGPTGTAFITQTEFASLVPDVADQTVAELAAAALVSDRHGARKALRRLDAIDRILVASEDPPTGLHDISTDLVNATLDDERAYDASIGELLKRDDIDDELRARLELDQDDDPLRLANKRIWDARMIKWGKAFNAVAEPLGQSIMSHQMAPYRLSRALLQYFLALREMPKILLQERQALAYWKEFMREHPDAPEVDVLMPRIENADARLTETQRNTAVRQAKQALSQGNARLALIFADRALRHMPEDGEAEELLVAAEEQLLYERENRARSVGVMGGGDVDVSPPEAHPLAVAMLDPSGDAGAAAEELLASDPEGPLADEARYVRAIARGEAGDEDAMWEELGEIAEDEDSNMARHATALIVDPEQNPYGAFRSSVWAMRKQKGLWVLLGPFYGGPNKRNLPKPIMWAVDLPAMAQTMMGTPVRLLQLHWEEPMPAEKAAAVFGHKYLARKEDGQHAEDVREWLIDFESDRGNWLGALEVAENDPEFDSEELFQVRRRAANQMLQAATNEKRRDMRHVMYRRLARDFPDTEAGEIAGYRARNDAENATAHRIQITRGFLEENPEVAGPAGLGLQPRLLDEERNNGELHKEGVALIGGRRIEVYYVAGKSDDDDPPVVSVERISEDRLARVVSQLEEVSFENYLEDAGDPVVADAQRDVFFERARLGLADEIDMRAGAEANFAYRGMRERYGMVRSRDSILPFDIVIQGNMLDLSLGAFPRIREPRKTPDAFLFR